ncbi:MAG: DUF1360 domain-containing protein [Acidobacteriia bacterium]|nr:DUF1360 domain-containing protein [Terriglobia bacterium]
MQYGFRLLLAALAVWRITHLVAKEEGPWRVFERWRRVAPGQLFSCFYCLSVWVAAPFVWFTGGSLLEKFVTWWALSGAAVLLERVTEKPFELEVKEEEEEEPDGELLRTERRAAGR